MPFGRVIGHGPGNIVLGGDPAPKGAQPSPIFGQCLLLPNGWMDQGATSIGTDVGFGPGHVVLDGDHLPQKGAQQPPPPIYGPCLL